MTEINYILRLDHLYEAATDALHAMSDVRYDAVELIFIILAQYPNPLIEENWHDPDDVWRFQSVVNALVSELYPALERLNIFTNLKQVQNKGCHFIITVDRPE